MEYNDFIPTEELRKRMRNGKGKKKTVTKTKLTAKERSEIAKRGWEKRRQTETVEDRQNYYQVPRRSL